MAQALERAREQTPSLGLVDLRLPDGDGVELAQQLQRQVGRFPLILMTAYPLRLRDQPELAKGFAHVLTKPLNLDELRQAIETSLGRPQMGEPARTAERSLVIDTRPPAFTRSEPDRRADAGTRAESAFRRWACAGRHRRGVARVWPWLSAAGYAGHSAVSSSRRPRRFGDPRCDSGRGSSPIGTRKSSCRMRWSSNLGVTSDPVLTAVTPRPLVLAGSLSFDPNRPRQACRRVSAARSSLSARDRRTLPTAKPSNGRSLWDRVTKGQVMAVVLSKDLGEKKNELVDALVRLVLTRRTEGSGGVGQSTAGRPSRLSARSGRRSPRIATP